MKNATTLVAPSEVEFLKKVQTQNLNFSAVLMAAPPRLLNASIQEVSFPTRFVNSVQGASTLIDLLRFHPENMAGKNLGARTIQVATEELKKFFVKKINQPNLVTLREMMKDYTQDLLAREARIFEMRMGIDGTRYTLEAVGEKFGLTRERVRQIEEVLVTQFALSYPAVKIIKSAVRDGMTFTMLVVVTGELLSMTDPLPLVGILETLDPKFHLVSQDGMSPVISSKPQTDFSVEMKQNRDIIVEIFRASNHLLTVMDIEAALKAHNVEDAAAKLAISKVQAQGHWVDGMLISPNKDRTNYAIGTLQASTRPVHIESVANDVRMWVQEEQTVEALRASLALVPQIRWFGYGMVGLAKHIPLNPEMAKEVVAFCERVVQRGPSGYQWNVKDLLTKVQDKWPTVHMEHHELNVILHDSEKLAYLGRLTWVLKGEHDTERKLYRNIFMSVLNRAGKPIPESLLIERVKKQRGLHLNVHLRNEVEVIELSPKMWGLTRRDNPFSKSEMQIITKAFDDSYGQDFTDEYLDGLRIYRKGMRASEIAKIIEVNS